MLRSFVAPLSLLILGTSPAVGQAPVAHELVRYSIAPAQADPAITRYTAPNYVVTEKETPATAPLLIFLPGTDGAPNRSSDFADVAAHQGYRVIGLEYNDTPAVMQVCPRDPDPKCAEKFREKRIFGDGKFDAIDQRPEESIEHRLSTLLVLLDREHPADGWAGYLEGGKPNWKRIAVSGLSQGAGMAAYIAQKTRVARVILFSSPWDNYGAKHTFSPWVTRGNGATPSELWFGAYHAKEPTADLIGQAYALLKVPRDHIRIFTLEPSNGGEYHPSGSANRGTPRLPDGSPAYLGDWKFLIGTP